MPESAKNKIREQRVQITQQSFGRDLEDAAVPVPWIKKFGTMFAVGVVAFVVAAAPAIIALKQ
jgi:hypothetical protein